MALTISAYQTWEDLPGAIRTRWRAIAPWLVSCFRRGLHLELYDDQQTVDRGLTESERAIFGGRAATYIRYSKRLLMTSGLASGVDIRYAPYRPDIHEIGHAVRFLLVPGRLMWLSYFPSWARAKLAHSLPSLYAATSVEEGWAEDFEALFRAGDEGARARINGILLGIMAMPA